MEKYKWVILAAACYVVWLAFNDYYQPNTVEYWLFAVITAGLSQCFIHRHEENEKKHGGWGQFGFFTIMTVAVLRYIVWWNRG